MVLACGGSKTKPAQGRTAAVSAKAKTVTAGGDPAAVRDGKAAPKPAKGSKKKAPPLPDATTIPVLDASRLAVEPAPPAEAVQRNLFSFEEDPVVVAERKRQAEIAAEQARKAQEEAEKKRREQEEYARLHPPPPQPPAIPFEFLGYFGDPKKRIGVFAPKAGGDPTLAVEGDKIFGTFQVVEIGFESAEIGFEKFKETKRIPISATSGGK